ncbi:MAG TPA: hypothetical protein VJC03_00230, partial [bacterium]|nr:hypothetical protein [bacterium]
MGPEVDVYKVGGESLESFLKSPPRGRYILVHGAGKEISRIMEKRGLKPRYIGGQRCTDEKTLEVVSAVMDMTRRKIMDVFGTRAVAVRGDEFGFLAKKINKLGLVGDVYDYPDKLLLELVKKRILVISPLAKTVKGETLNINADLFAQALVSKLPVRRL